MKQELIKQIKKMNGNVLGIGIKDDEVIEAINSNSAITTCNLLDLYQKKGRKTTDKKSKNKKTFHIKKLKKVFKKKQIDYVICNYEEVSPYLKYVIRDTVYINKGKTYFYGSVDDYVVELIESRYHRYRVTTKKMRKREEFMIQIDNETSKNNRLLDCYYWWMDTVVSIIDAIADLLMG